MRTCFKFIHPILPISLVLLGIVAWLARGGGGPCPSPIILLFPVLFLGVLLGLILSAIRTARQFRAKKAPQEPSSTP